MDQAEQLRNVIKLHNQNNQNNARVVTITSGKGGVGKSNLAVNLAVCLRKAGKRVIIFDADFGLANVEVMFGAIPQYNLSDFIYRGKSIRVSTFPTPWMPKRPTACSSPLPAQAARMAISARRCCSSA